MKTIEDIFVGATFKDFLVRPQYGQIVSRTKDNIDLSMPLTRRITLKGAPIVSANMSTVTGARMMKAMPSLGCFGFINRRYSKEVQDAKVREVKRSQSYIIEKPLAIWRRATLGEARDLIRKRKISGLLVEESPGSNILAGILSHRDISGSDSELVENHMTHFDKVIFGTNNIGINEAEKMMNEFKKEKLPLLDDERQILGLVTMRDLKRAKQRPYATLDKKGRLLVGATIGASGDYMERAEMLIDAGADIILIDIAHGHSEVMRRALVNFRGMFKDTELVAGNVCTGEGAEFLARLGVDAVKVGVGPGRGCRTRLDVRVGVSQLQAIRETFLAVGDRVPIIADGGIEDHGDINIALAVGASTVMLGGLLAGTDEAPGIVENGMKMYRGETSLEASLEDIDDDEDLDQFMDDVQAPEGQPRPVKAIGKVSKVIKNIRGHLKSFVSYSGEKSLLDAHKKISKSPLIYLGIRKLTEASKKESFDRSIS